MIAEKSLEKKIADLLKLYFPDYPIFCVLSGITETKESGSTAIIVSASPRTVKYDGKSKIEIPITITATVKASDDQTETSFGDVFSLITDFIMGCSFDADQLTTDDFTSYGYEVAGGDPPRWDPEINSWVAKFNGIVSGKELKNRR